LLVKALPNRIVVLFSLSPETKVAMRALESNGTLVLMPETADEVQILHNINAYGLSKPRMSGSLPRQPVLSFTYNTNPHGEPLTQEHDGRAACVVPA
jgi:hypothetical protein